MPNQRSKSFRTISDVLFNEKEFRQIIVRAKEEEVVERFSEIFPELKTIAKAVKFSNNVLFLRVENSVWRSELNLKQSALINKISKNIKDISIDRLKFIS
jgi:hypothetical protein